MPRQILTTTGPGLTDQWGFIGAASSWEAVSYGSDDSSYIYASLPVSSSDFFCGSGYIPVGGHVVGITLHYRMRETVAGSGASVAFSVIENGVPHAIAAVPTTAAWTSGELRTRFSWAVPGTRPTLPEIHNLGVGATILVAPSSGDVEISQLWVDVEIIDTPLYYDPVNGVLPDAVVGPLAWTGLGTQPVSITLLDKYLEIADAATPDFKAYIYSMSFDTFRQDYCTEIETRITLISSTVGTEHVVNIAGFSDKLHMVDLSVVRDGPIYYVGLIGAPLDHADPAAYLEKAIVDLEGHDLHFRIVIDRDTSPSTYGKVSAYLNYSAAPLLEHYFADFPVAAPAFGYFAFGTDFGQPSATVRYDYIAFRHYKKRGNTFAAWSELDLGPNTIVASGSDPEVVHHITIDPPGVVAGQSDYCCVLNILDSVQPCCLSQTYQLPAPLPTTYKIDLDYKIISPAPITAELTVQRVSDLWYWDTTVPGWVPVYASVVLPFVPTRTRVPLITGLSSVVPDAITITIKNTLLPSPPYQILLYKVLLDRE